jgi:uncharacterized protein
MKQHGAFSWSELMTTDAPAAKAFYSQLFGWAMEDQPIAGATYTVLKIGDQQVGGLMAITPDMPAMPAAWGVYVTVDDVDASAQQATALGGRVCVPPTDIPDVGRFAIIQDPQGAMLSIMTYGAT